MSDKTVEEVGTAVVASRDADLATRPQFNLASGSDVYTQVETAHRFPRPLPSVIKQRALELATLDQETAAMCFYCIPRAGKTISGPSVRLAEVMLHSYQNVSAGAEVVGDDGKFIYARGRAWDLETNASVQVTVRRRITNKSGQKFNDDMIAVTANAACSIALRNAIFKVIPSVYVNPIYEACRKASVGNAATMADTRAKMMSAFQKMGVTEMRILAALKVKAVEDIDSNMVADLRGAFNAIKDGEAQVDDIFPPPKKIPDGAHAFGSLGKAAPEAPETPAEPPAPTQEPEQEFVCPVCSKAYKTQGWLDRHKAEMGHRLAEEPEPEPEPQEAVPTREPSDPPEEPDFRTATAQGDNCPFCEAELGPPNAAGKRCCTGCGIWCDPPKEEE